jgi:hypothetical protein
MLLELLVSTIPSEISALMIVIFPLSLPLFPLPCPLLSVVVP